MVLLDCKPQDGSQDVKLNVTIELTFSVQPAQNVVFSRFIQLLKDNQPVQVSFERSGQKVFVKPVKSLAQNSDYTLYVHNRNIITREVFQGQDGTALDRSYVFRFRTGQAQVDTPQYELPIFNQPLQVSIEAQVTDEGQSVLYWGDQTFVVEFSDEVVSCDCEQTIEDLAGNVTHVVPQKQISGNKVAVTINQLQPNQFITVILKNVTFKNSPQIPQVELYKFSQLKPSFGSMRMLRLKFGKFQNMFKDHEIVASILRQQQTFEVLNNRTVLGSDSLSKEDESKIIELAKYLAIKDFLLQKMQVQNESVDFADLSVKYGDVDTKLLDYLDKSLEAIESEISVLKPGPEVAVQGLISENWVNSIKHARFKREQMKWKPTT